MAKLRGSTESKLTAVAKTLRVAVKSSISYGDLKSKIKGIAKSIEDEFPTRTCPHCESTDIVMFTADDDLCNGCGAHLPGH